MKTKAFDWRIGDEIAGPCMICYKEAAVCHGAIEFWKHETVNLMLCKCCSELSDQSILGKLGFPEGGK